MPNIKNTFVFDLDGTLIDTLQSLLISVNTTLAKLNLGSISKECCREFIGNGARELMRKSIVKTQGKCEEELLNEAMLIYGEVFNKFCDYEVKIYLGILELLDCLKTRSYKLAVLSNKPHEETVKIVKQYFGENYFDFIKGQTDDTPRKPNPLALTHVIEKMGSTKKQTVYIGDSEVDMQTGISAQVHTIGVSWGFRDRKVLEELSPQKIVDNANELYNYICEF